ncbi:MAG: DUF397 domain-containing protein [Stackebrandtia sp.]
MTINGPWRKSSRSPNQNGNCVEARVAGGWRKSSRSPGQNGTCVEARLAGVLPQLSDSKLADNRPILTLDEASYAGFMKALKAGAFDQRLKVQKTPARGPASPGRVRCVGIPTQHAAAEVWCHSVLSWRVWTKPSPRW